MKSLMFRVMCSRCLMSLELEVVFYTGLVSDTDVINIVRLLEKWYVMHQRYIHHETWEPAVEDFSSWVKPSVYEYEEREEL